MLDFQTAQPNKLLDIPPFAFHQLENLPSAVQRKQDQRIKQGKAFSILYRGIIDRSLIQVTISKREDCNYLGEKVPCYIVILFSLVRRPHRFQKPKYTNPVYIDTNIEAFNIVNKTSYRRLYTLKKKTEFKAATLDQAKNFIQMQVQKDKFLGTTSSFVEGMKSKIIETTDHSNLNNLIKRTHVTSAISLNFRSNGFADTRTGLKTYDQILRQIMSLDKRERVEIDKYFHPMIPYTWKPGIITDDAYCEAFLNDQSPLQKEEQTDYTMHPYYLQYNDFEQHIDLLKSHELDKIIQPGFHEMKKPHKYDRDGKSFLNPNLYDGVKILAEQSYKKDTRTIINPSEYATFLDMMYENQPRDEYGFPLEIEAPECNIENIAAHGPRATAGGVDNHGNRHTKTNLYGSTITESLKIVQACKNMTRELSEHPTDKVTDMKHRVIMSPLMSSVKNEILKRGKKVRFFTLTQAPFELLETFVYAQIMDNSKSVTYDAKGGNRLMIGNSLEKGFGKYLLDTMILRNGEDLDKFHEEIKSFNPKKVSADFNDKDYYDKSQDKPFPTLGRAKSFVTDYSSQEFQHNTIHRLLSLISTHKFYVSDKKERDAFFMIMAIVGELTTQVDVDLGAGQLLCLPPGHVGSGCKLTLLGNGNSNKYELGNASLEAAISLKRGYYFKRNYRLPKAEAVERGYEQVPNELNLTTHVGRTLMNIHNNTIFQGDDGYLATLDGDVATFAYVITIMRDTYSNQIKSDVHNLLAIHDSKGYDVRDAGDFLKIKPTITKRGVFFIRDTAIALQKMFLPNSLPFNAVTQLFASISQSYTSNGNYFSYKLASYKTKILSMMITKDKISIGDDDRNAYITLLETQKDVKNNTIIEHLMVNGFTELDFSAINEKFLKTDVIHIHEKQEQTAYYRQYGMSKNMIINMRLGYAK